MEDLLMYNNKDITDTTDSDIQADLRRVKDKARETRDALSQTATDVKSRASDALSQGIEDARAKSELLQEDVIEYVQANPLKSVGISLLAGAVIALLLRG
jgi:ElaB/YqjD/DUF883 family membrane-anchored ribosome-binding protein